MDRLLLERLIGAGVLVALLVFIVPAILDGDSGSSDSASSGSGSSDTGSYSDSDSGSSSGGKPAEPAPSAEPRRTHTIRLDQSTERPPVAREVSEPVKPSAASASTPEPVAAVDPQAAPKSTADVKPKPESKALAAPPVKSAPVKSVPVKSASVPTAGWVVQLGSFSNKQNAQRLTDEVSARGFPAFMMPLKRSGKKLYRVRVGPRNTREQATDLAGRLAKVGYTGQVTRQLPDA